ncbi:MAG TPA: maleylacetoacetate isomerase [Roseomonas sp.]|nr:maleylacetoacetate isomerase [Roseomonas sp.]
MRLHGYRRSSATLRVRLALSLKGLSVPETLYSLPGEWSREQAERGIAPPGMMPALELPDGTVIAQSFAILEWLEEIWPSPPLLPPDPLTRARVRAFAMMVTCDVQPLQGRRAHARLCAAGLSEGEAQGWLRQAIAESLDACETMLCGSSGPFCFGETPGMADICLVPQLQAARQFGVHLAFPRLLAAEAASMTLPAFQQSHPEIVYAQ